MSDPAEYEDRHRNPYWFMRVYWWDGWRYVGFWLYSVALVLWGMWLG